jgi:hypothetical protein
MCYQMTLRLNALLHTSQVYGGPPLYIVYREAAAPGGATARKAPFFPLPPLAAAKDRDGGSAACWPSGKGGEV